MRDWLGTLSGQCSWLPHGEGTSSLEEATGIGMGGWEEVLGSQPGQALGLEIDVISNPRGS